MNDLLANQRDECALIEHAAANGIVINHRSDTHPQALLGVSLVTQGQARSSLLSLVTGK